MMQNSPTPHDAGLEKRHRALLVMWAAMLLSLGLYAALAVLWRPRGGTANDALALVLVGVGGALALASFLVKQRLLSRAVAEQRPEVVTNAYVVGLALCEAAGVLGLASAFAAGGGFFYLLFVVAGAGLLLHFPRRDDLLAAAYDQGRATITGS